MIASMNYTVGANFVMKHPEISKKLKMLKDAGVTDLWLMDYSYGKYDCDEETLLRARQRLLEEGFSTGVLSLPVGHPGNSLDPFNPNIELAIKKTWRYRVDKHGKEEYYIACINDTMINDNLEAAKLFTQLGFTRHFFDDDLRLGNHGDEVQGCFCDDCIQKFNAQVGMKLDRETLKRACLGDEALLDIKEKWIEYNCSKLTDFMVRTKVPEMISGIMVMHDGGRIHGISIPDIKKALPDCMFRVGEWHFDDAKYLSPGGKESLANSVHTHLSLIGDNPAYSESTIFPAGALSPDNFIDKIKLELSLGLKNIFVMGGSRFIDDIYWERLKKDRDMLIALSEEV